MIRSIVLPLLGVALVHLLLAPSPTDTQQRARDAAAAQRHREHQQQHAVNHRDQRHGVGAWPAAGPAYGHDSGALVVESDEGEGEGRGGGGQEGEWEDDGTGGEDGGGWHATAAGWEGDEDGGDVEGEGEEEEEEERAPAATAGRGSSSGGGSSLTAEAARLPSSRPKAGVDAMGGVAGGFGSGKRSDASGGGGGGGSRGASGRGKFTTGVGPGGRQEDAFGATSSTPGSKHQSRKQQTTKQQQQQQAAGDEQAEAAAARQRLLMMKRAGQSAFAPVSGSGVPAKHAAAKTTTPANPTAAEQASAQKRRPSPTKPPASPPTPPPQPTLFYRHYAHINHSTAPCLHVYDGHHEDAHGADHEAEEEEGPTGILAAVTMHTLVCSDPHHQEQQQRDGDNDAAVDCGALGAAMAGVANHRYHHTYASGTGSSYVYHSPSSRRLHALAANATLRAGLAGATHAIVAAEKAAAASEAVALSSDDGLNGTAASRVAKAAQLLAQALASPALHDAVRGTSSHDDRTDASSPQPLSPLALWRWRESARSLVRHAYSSYMRHAYPWDELKPLSCAGRRWDARERGTLDDPLGGFSLTLIDSLSALATVGDLPAFRCAVSHVVTSINLSRNVQVSVFETSIRVLGGLLSAHLLASDAGLRIFEHDPRAGDAGFRADDTAAFACSSDCSAPTCVRVYNGELLAMARHVADALLPAFDTPTGMPYHRINLATGDVDGASRDTCTAAVGTYLLEWGVLSLLTGNPVYGAVARRAAGALWARRSGTSGLVGANVDAVDGNWRSPYTGIGAGVDSYIEYMLKAGIALGDDTLLAAYQALASSISAHTLHGGVHIEVGTGDGKPISGKPPVVSALQAFYAGVEVLAGHVTEARAHQAPLWALMARYGGRLPEAHDITTNSPIHFARDSPLRPELLESTYHLYRATRDPSYLRQAWRQVQLLQQDSRVQCGYAAIADVTTLSNGDATPAGSATTPSGQYRLDDRMDSFFISETGKYAFMIFDEAMWGWGDDVQTGDAPGAPAADGGGGDQDRDGSPVVRAASALTDHLCSRVMGAVAGNDHLAWQGLPPQRLSKVDGDRGLLAALQVLLHHSHVPEERDDNATSGDLLLALEDAATAAPAHDPLALQRRYYACMARALHPNAHPLAYVPAAGAQRSMGEGRTYPLQEHVAASGTASTAALSAAESLPELLAGESGGDTLRRALAAAGIFSDLMPVIRGTPATGERTLSASPPAALVLASLPLDASDVVLTTEGHTIPAAHAQLTSGPLSRQEVAACEAIAADNEEARSTGRATNHGPLCAHGGRCSHDNSSMLQGIDASGEGNIGVAGHWWTAVAAAPAPVCPVPLPLTAAPLSPPSSLLLSADRRHVRLTHTKGLPDSGSGQPPSPLSLSRLVVRRRLSTAQGVYVDEDPLTPSGRHDDSGDASARFGFRLESTCPLARLRPALAHMDASRLRFVYAGGSAADGEGRPAAAVDWAAAVLRTRRVGGDGAGGHLLAVVAASPEASQGSGMDAVAGMAADLYAWRNVLHRGVPPSAGIASDAGILPLLYPLLRHPHRFLGSPDIQPAELPHFETTVAHSVRDAMQAHTNAPGTSGSDHHHQQPTPAAGDGVRHQVQVMIDGKQHTITVTAPTGPVAEPLSHLPDGTPAAIANWLRGTMRPQQQVAMLAYRANSEKDARQLDQWASTHTDASLLAIHAHLATSVAQAQRLVAQAHARMESLVSSTSSSTGNAASPDSDSHHPRVSDILAPIWYGTGKEPRRRRGPTSAAEASGGASGTPSTWHPTTRHERLVRALLHQQHALRHQHVPAGNAAAVAEQQGGHPTSQPDDATDAGSADYEDEDDDVVDEHPPPPLLHPLVAPPNGPMALQPNTLFSGTSADSGNAVVTTLLATVEPPPMAASPAANASDISASARTERATPASCPVRLASTSLRSVRPRFHAWPWSRLAMFPPQTFARALNGAVDGIAASTGHGGDAVPAGITQEADCGAAASAVLTTTVRELSAHDLQARVCAAQATAVALHCDPLTGLCSANVLPRELRHVADGSAAARVISTPSADDSTASPVSGGTAADGFEDLLQGTPAVVMRLRVQGPATMPSGTGEQTAPDQSQSTGGGTGQMTPAQLLAATSGLRDDLVAGAAASGAAGVAGAASLAFGSSLLVGAGAAFFGPELTHVGVSVQAIALANPLDGCSSGAAQGWEYIAPPPVPLHDSTNSSSTSGRHGGVLAIVVRGGCSFAHKARAAAEGIGASAVVVVDLAPPTGGNDAHPTPPPPPPTDNGTVQAVDPSSWSWVVEDHTTPTPAAATSGHAVDSYPPRSPVEFTMGDDGSGQAVPIPALFLNGRAAEVFVRHLRLRAHACGGPASICGIQQLHQRVPASHRHTIWSDHDASRGAGGVKRDHHQLDHHSSPPVVLHVDIFNARPDPPGLQPTEADWLVDTTGTASDGSSGSGLPPAVCAALTAHAPSGAKAPAPSLLTGLLPPLPPGFAWSHATLAQATRATAYLQQACVPPIDGSTPLPPPPPPSTALAVRPRLAFTPRATSLVLQLVQLLFTLPPSTTTTTTTTT